MAQNFATDFTYPATLTSTGGNVNCPITLMPYSSRNQHWVYMGPADNYSLSTRQYALKGVWSGTYNINVPASMFKRNNATLMIEVGTWEDGVTFVSGSYGHTVLLLHPNYKHYLHTFTFPLKTYPGDTCTIDILQPKDKHPNGTYVDVDIMYHQSVGREIVGTNLGPGKFSFVVPPLSINSSITIYATTRDKKTGASLGVISQSLKIERSSYSSSSTSVSKVLPPTITLPDNYSLTLSEGVNVKIKGSSENIDDYMIIYAKKPCDVSNAVSQYTSAQSYFAASQTELKNNLLNNAIGDANYYVLKAFDSDTTFITQDPNDKKTFWIRTPGTNDYEIINDFYALQWFKDIEPGDLVYIYVIQRGIKYTTTTITTTASGHSSAKVINADAWTCKHCNLYNYAWWNRSSNWNPYCKVSLSEIRTFINSNSSAELSAVFTAVMGQAIKYPPVIYVTTSSGANATGSTYLTTIASTDGTKFSYSIPMSFLRNAVKNGYSNIYFHTHWGQNTENSVQYSQNGLVTLAAFIRGGSTSTSTTTQSIAYSDNNYTNIKNIALSTMTPYIVVPPAVRPLELAEKERTKDHVTVSYANPLYGKNTESIATYSVLDGVYFDISSGDDVNDYSSLNAIEDENGNDVQVDPTLDVNSGEKRLLTYEKTIPMTSKLLSTLRNVDSNYVFMDLHLKSIDENPLNFKTITSSGIKIQMMFSKSGENRTRIFDFDSSVIDYKKSEYILYKAKVNKNIFVDNDFDTIHLLYNTDKYDNGKSFAIESPVMQISDNQVSSAIGWRKINEAKNIYGTCSFTSKTFEIARYALNYDTYKLRLCLENMSADKALFAPPIIKVTHRNIAAEGEEAITESILAPVEQGVINPGEDIHYDIPYRLYNVNIDDILVYTMSSQSPYPLDMPEITFSNAYIEVIGLYDIEQVIDKYSTGFTAAATFFKEEKTGTNIAGTVSVFDPVECVDVIICCFDSNNQLINKTTNKRRDIYNGKEFVYYTDRRWHNFVNDKYINNIKYKSNYDMTFPIPEGTEYYFIIAFTYSNWYGNPSIYSMSNILTVNSIKQDFALEFVNPIPLIDEIDGRLYANSDINNPAIAVKINAQKNSNISITNNAIDNGFNLAKDPFDRNKWLANPIIYSNTKQFGYEQPIFNAVDSYVMNNVNNTLEPLYNDIEYYYHWKNLYGKEKVLSIFHKTNIDPIEINSKYTMYEDEADKFISNRAVPYIEIPAELAFYERSKITLFLDADFGADV